jgi:hypothetical protein
MWMQIRHRRLLRALILALLVYAVVAVGLLIFIHLKARAIEPADVEVPHGTAPLDFETLPRLKPGVYGPGHRFHLMLGPDVRRTTINRFGSRNLFQVNPADGREHVVLLGDSFFFGFSLTDHQTAAYHLGRLDPGRRYVNLAHPGYNLNDSVTRYLGLWGGHPPPRQILFQVLLSNDIADELRMYKNVLKYVGGDAALVLPPLHWIYPSQRVFMLSWKAVWSKIHRDTTRERFDAYVRRPLDRLMRNVPSRTRVALVVFPDANENWREGFERYDRRLRRVCRQQGIAYINVLDLVGATLYESRLSDYHPSAALNRALARALHQELVEGMRRRD